MKEDFTINEMQEMQRNLQDKYKDKWEAIGPETGKNKLLWMVGEIGEVVDIVKKNGGTKACTDAKLRNDLVEEMADVLMYYNDVMLCYGITAEELKQSYSKKYKKNMERWVSMTHCMNLWDDSFQAIKEGWKTVEMRLNDGKRSIIDVDDIIEFTNTTTQEKMSCKVMNIYKYSDFAELYKHHSKISIGYTEDETANPDDMLSYYTKEDIEKYGVVGIEISVIEQI